jgi:hypothetical protein
MARRKRDYKAEYQRRIQRAQEKGYSKRVARGHPRRKELGIRAAATLGLPPGTDLDEYVAADARRVFAGHRPKRRETSIPDFMLRLAELQRTDGEFDWTSEAAFIAQMTALGLTEHEAYGKLFGS